MLTCLLNHILNVKGVTFQLAPHPPYIYDTDPTSTLPRGLPSTQGNITLNHLNKSYPNTRLSTYDQVHMVFDYNFTLYIPSTKKIILILLIDEFKIEDKIEAQFITEWELEIIKLLEEIEKEATNWQNQSRALIFQIMTS